MRIALCVALLVGFFGFHYTYAVKPAWALSDAGATTAEPPSAQIDDPIEQPAAAWDDLKAARKTSWPMAVMAALLMLTKALARAGEKIKALAFLGKGKAAFAIAAAATVVAAAFDVLASGGSWVAVLTAAGVALFALLVPTAKPAIKVPA